MGRLNQILLAALFCVGTLGFSLAWAPTTAGAQWGTYGSPFGRPWGGTFSNGVVIQRGAGFGLNVGPGGYVTIYRSGYGNYGPGLGYGSYYGGGYGSYYGSGVGPYYGSGYGSYYGSGYGSYYGSGYGSYYGNGVHDYQPHWHSTQTPGGTYNWYGNGPHDAAPHQHVVTPFGTQGFSQTQAGPTTSFNGVPAY